MAEIAREPTRMDPEKPSSMESSLRSEVIGVLEARVRDAFVDVRGRAG